MATRVLLPKQGLQMVEGTIVRWLKKPGDAVSEGDPLVEIETDKTNLEIPSPATGVVLVILRKDGEVVPVAETIAVLGSPGEDISALVPGPAAAGGRVFSTPRARLAAAEAGIEIGKIAGTGPDGLVTERDVKQSVSRAQLAPSATHLAEKIASQRGIDIGRVGPATPGAKIRKDDVLQLADAPMFGQAAAAAVGSIAAPSRMRAIIAKRMKESLDTAAQTDMQADVDCSEMARLRDGLKKAGKSVTFTDILVKVVGCALRRHPAINTSWTDGGMLRRSDVNIGIAVGLAEGLIVPVIRNADSLSIERINAVSRELIAKARDGKLQPQIFEGAGFTISNLGMFGIDRFTAIINQPESAILAVGQIKDKPIVVNKAIEVRPLMTLTLSYDHRVIDGAPAAQFLATVKEYVQNPYLLIA